jgi:hypothetical protein
LKTGVTLERRRNRMEEQVVGGRNWKHSKELCNAIYDDWKHDVVDNAKKRAVAQNVDYPTFANLVFLLIPNLQ